MKGLPNRIFLSSLMVLLLIACGNDSETDNTPKWTEPEVVEPVPTEPKSDAIIIQLDTSQQFQTLAGFGAAIAWYQSYLVNHPKAEEIYDIIFDGLGLDILRLRNRYQREDISANLSHEQTILNAANNSLGYFPQILMSSWTPPASMKANGSEDCFSNENCTLKKVDGNFVYNEFGNYWRDSLEHYQSLGINPNWISIQNEPGFIGAWEGCKFTPTEGQYPAYGIALNAVTEALYGLNDKPLLLGAESLSPHYNREINMQANLNQNQLAGIAHHLYESGSDGLWDWRDPGPDSYISAMQNAEAAANGLPIFMTEFETNEDKSVDGGLETAWLIHNSLVEANNVAWLYWDLVWGRTDGIDNGLVSMTSNNYVIRDQYYALRHYAKHTSPGDIRIAATSNEDDLRISSFKSADDTRVTVIIINVGTEQQTINIDLDDFVANQLAVYQSEYNPGNSKNWQTLAGFTVTSDLSIPAKSQTTLVFK